MADNEVKENIRKRSVELCTAIEKRAAELLSTLSDQSQAESTGQIFILEPNLLEKCLSLGTVIDKKLLPQASKCHVTGDLQEATVDEASHVTVHLLADGRSSFDTKNLPIDVKLINIHEEVEMVGERVRGRREEEEEEDRVSFRYVPHHTGPHTLHITILGEPVRGSPFKLSIKAPLKLRFLVKSVVPSFYKPGGVAIGPNGELALIDTEGWKTIYLYNNQLEPILTIGDWGSGPGQCYRPIGVAFDSSGNLLVVDGDNHRINKYDRTGTFIMSVGQKGNKELEFLRPTGIGVNKAGYVYVCDRANHRIQILKPNLTFDSMFGGYGEETGYLHYPWDVAFDSEGMVYATVPGQYSIKKFSPNGVYHSTVVDKNTQGFKEGEPKCLEMLFIDEWDYMYVTDRECHCVFVFDTGGRFHARVGNYGSAEGQFYYPRGVAKGEEGLYVSEAGNKRLQLFG
ncbi:PREDICTED: E3 ubiquitin-protein ligase TRIM71-like [Amphimedon queenslandica]|uniref:Uncharacterized protein n=1 Tax=Amphimedon queenslandica TaxID=400682 RepID=A0A1X7TVU4_AMPQE|nr:PREDICTED: E3 ubiquitin-protein ligase TRIM71-like [Amphimedon queenslandica]|eukprot:XP_011406702.1 PREDICTED: E3 ubiquitin-protein ligase TRIM71-like [Amphimedon queenslandica]